MFFIRSLLVKYGKKKRLVVVATSCFYWVTNVVIILANEEELSFLAIWTGITHSPFAYALQWRHNGRDCVSNHQPHHCLLNRLFRCRSKKTSNLCVAGLCEGNSPGTGEFPSQRASKAENMSIFWRHHDNYVLRKPCHRDRDGNYRDYTTVMPRFCTNWSRFANDNRLSVTISAVALIWAIFGTYPIRLVVYE